MKHLVFALIAVTTLVVHADDGPWEALAQPGAVVLFRHATAPGVSDPPGFRLDDCATQRNLDEQGRGEAARIGEEFRRRGIAVGAVWSSQWCRARDTARLAFGAQARHEPAFDALRQGPPERDAQLARAREVLAGWRGPGVLVVVTHQVNIAALTGRGALSAEGVVVRPAAMLPWTVLARIPPP
ncbi:MAG TPA: histidine phosphatase family protein [Ramlibacter sp.]|jgi:phosphohistidine phosphatase SixA|nr:histidine phosphatase family protein [Ramlibacter sp.]